MSSDADLIIAGAGCAGLSAVWFAALLAPSDTRILILDRSCVPGSNRTWGFWGPPDAPFINLADRTWQSLQVRFPDWHSTQDIGVFGSRVSGRVYARVRQQDFDDAVHALVADRPNVRFIETEILDVIDEPDGACVVTAAGEFRSPVVFQSVRLSPQDRNARVRHPLRQHFGGWEVRTENPIFDPEVATLMDFDTAQTTGDVDATAFFYLLPEAKDRALIEYTIFSLDPEEPGFYDAHLQRRLVALGAGQIHIERREYGVIPMEDRVVHQRSGAHIWNLGTVGGRTKPTTGYTFQRIHSQTHHLVTTWLEHGHPIAVPSAPRRYGLADRTLLNILHRRPNLGRPIFEHLFRTSTIDDVLTFLEERSSPRQDARLFVGLPWRPFLRAAAEEIAATCTAKIESVMNAVSHRRFPIPSRNAVRESEPQSDRSGRCRRVQ